MTGGRPGMRCYEVPEDGGGVRLDVFVSRLIPSGSRRVAMQALRAGQVTVNGVHVPKGRVLLAGNMVCVAEEVFVQPTVVADRALDLRVLYEDDLVVAVDKPAGVPSHVLRRGEVGTVANFLVGRYPEMAAVRGDPREAGLVHRLDTDTSGVLLAARTAAAYLDLRRQFAQGCVHKGYLAVVVGVVRGAGEVRARLVPDSGDGRRVRCATTAGAGRPALTRYRPLRRLAGYTLLAIEIPTGMRHQIRVHLAAIGHPVAGDRLYGTGTEAGPPGRQLLHARRVVVTHPGTGRRIVVESPVPADMAAFVAAHETRRASRREAGRPVGD